MSALHEYTNGAGQAVPLSVNPRLAAARARLALANAEVERLGAELVELNKPAARLAEITTAAAKAEQRRNELLALDNAALGEWLLAGKGDRPEPNVALLECERALIALNRDRSAIEVVTPDVTARAGRVAERLRDAGIERNGLVHDLAASVAIDFIDGELRRRVLAFVGARSLIGGLVEILLVGSGSSGAVAAERVRNHLRSMLREIDEKPNEAAGRRFLTRLFNDPDAEL